MSLNNIELTSFHLTQLFQKVLVEPLKKNAPPVSPAVKFLGKNERNILVLVREENYPFLSDAHLQFLTNILSACKLSLADIALINVINHDGEDIHELIEFFKGKHIIAFGIEPLSMGLPASFPAFQVQHMESRSFIHSPELEALEQDQQLKKQLWLSLKKMFNL